MQVLGGSQNVHIGSISDLGDLTQGNEKLCLLWKLLKTTDDTLFLGEGVKPVNDEIYFREPIDLRSDRILISFG